MDCQNIIIHKLEFYINKADQIHYNFILYSRSMVPNASTPVRRVVERPNYEKLVNLSIKIKNDMK